MKHKRTLLTSSLDHLLTILEKSPTKGNFEGVDTPMR